MGNSYCKIDHGFIVLVCNVKRTNWTEHVWRTYFGGFYDFMFKVYIFSSSMVWFVDEQIHWFGVFFFLFVGFSYFNRYVWCTTHHLEVGDSFRWRWHDMETQSTHELLWTKGNVIRIHLSFFVWFILFAQVGMALILLYLLLLCIGTKCTCFNLQIYDIHNPRVHFKAGFKKKNKVQQILFIFH